MFFILIGFLIHLGLFICGILALILYVFYVFRNLRHFSKKDFTHIIKADTNGEKTKAKQVKIKKFSKLKKIVLVIISFIFIFIGGVLLIIATEELIAITQIPEAFFGFVIIAFVTNVEELTLVFKSIKKQAIEIGLGGMIGKLIWNLTITFGISGIIAMNIIFTWILIWNWLILFGLIVYFNLISKKKFIGSKDGIILMLFFITFIMINLLTFGLFSR